MQINNTTLDMHTPHLWQFGTVVSAVEREVGFRNCVGSIPSLGN